MMYGLVCAMALMAEPASIDGWYSWTETYEGGYKTKGMVTIKTWHRGVMSATWVYDSGLSYESWGRMHDGSLFLTSGAKREDIDKFTVAVVGGKLTLVKKGLVLEFVKPLGGD